ncbi:MAG: hypothetical protein U1F77_09745 [Kiritimatiellia bacterium]
MSLANSSALTGWYFSEGGSNANTIITANNGSSATGDSFSMGTGSDRALGGIAKRQPHSNVQVLFHQQHRQHDHGSADLYVGETWRVGAASRPDGLNFQYSTSATGLSGGTWTSLQQSGLYESRPGDRKRKRSAFRQHQFDDHLAEPHQRFNAVCPLE